MTRSDAWRILQKMEELRKAANSTRTLPASEQTFRSIEMYEFEYSVYAKMLEGYTNNTVRFT